VLRLRIAEVKFWLRLDKQEVFGADGVGFWERRAREKESHHEKGVLAINCDSSSGRHNWNKCS
jgi:hypothetical protein